MTSALVVAIASFAIASCSGPHTSPLSSVAKTEPTGDQSAGQAGDGPGDPSELAGPAELDTAEAPAVVPAPVVPAPPPEPAYDLDADIAARENIAREALGEKVRLARVEDVFLVVGDRRMSKRAFARSLRFVRKTVAAYTNDRFGRLPDRAVGIYLFATLRPYERYCNAHYGGCGTPYGVYFTRDRRIVMNIGPGIGTLSHELVHPILEADFPEAPTWIDEGIASLFERPWYPRPGEVHGKKNWRYPRLARALRSKSERELATLDRLVGMSDEVFRGHNEDLHYAMARYLCQWLDERGELWPFYQQWRDGYADDPSGRATFERVVGRSPADAQRDWARWVKRL